MSVPSLVLLDYDGSLLRIRLEKNLFCEQKIAFETFFSCLTHSVNTKKGIPFFGRFCNLLFRCL